MEPTKVESPQSLVEMQALRPPPPPQNVDLSRPSGVAEASSTSSSTSLIYRQDRRARGQAQGPQDVTLGEQTPPLLGSDSQ